MKWGYKGEQDLFVVRATLELLARDSNVDVARRFFEGFPWEGERTLLMNFVVLLLDAMEVKDFNFYKEILGRYQSQFGRDPAFVEYLDKIALKHYGKPLKEASGLEAVFNLIAGNK
mmetsp:Transcript_33937/g.25010  ORF Transcript_33937/g.25010 Transcript_33937/m.25010 type:complete len:116 (-) Transcript_33937:2312-2659(-)